MRIPSQDIMGSLSLEDIRIAIRGYLSFKSYKGINCSNADHVKMSPTTDSCFPEKSSQVCFVFWLKNP